MTQQDLQKKLDACVAQREQMVANANALQGAINILTELIKELTEAETT